ncbi:hypothetical protein EXIGLDRAFT_768159 [Exidia glandulosa HHB12029]|uniref:Uncharacterized protein n=1 Tax=Exidia glandulosa HHB12029 TaxID=1314781 RepID=A0A165IGY5_EXIGL|nr:hypothetical protein EXIGLDRAFT_768159 [Exidia glandulosa HHB12029]
MAGEKFLGSNAQRIFLATVLIQAGVVLAMVGTAFGLVEGSNVDIDTPKYKTLPCYLALFALAEVFELVIAVDALRLRNSLQLLAILEFHTALVVFSALQIGQTKSALVSKPDADCYDVCGGPHSLWASVQKLLIVVPVALGVSLIGMILTVRALYAEFGWAVFHAIGADPRMRTMYRYYQIMICLLKFDFFCFTGVTMQLLILVLSRNSAEFALTILAIPIVLVLLVMCGIAVQREIKWLMICSLILMAAAETYFVYKFIRLFLPSSRDRYITTRGTLAFFLIVAFLLLITSFFIGIICFKDFDKGLRAPKVQEGSSKPKLGAVNGSTPMGERQSSYMGGSALGPRMSIE